MEVAMKEFKLKTPVRYIINAVLISIVWVILTLFISGAGLKGEYYRGILITIGINIILATSLNVVCGYLGQLPLGHAGFMAVGAYAGAIFMKSTPAAQLLRAGNNAAVIPYLIIAVLLSALVAGLFGLLIGIPALRLKGDYLAIITLGFGEIMGNMVMQDSAQEVTLYGQYGQMWEENSRGYATDSALMIDWSDMDHLTHIHGDTLFTEELHFIDSTMRDSTFRRVRAHYGVRVYRDDMQMTCDSLVYMGSDSTIHLYIKPICWSENQQISADSITIYIVNGAVEHAVGKGNALCVMHDSLEYFNQMSGKQVIAYLIDGEVKTIDTDGNALTIYYAKEDDGDYVGMNTTESSFIRMYVENRKIHHMRFTKETTGVLYPMDQIPEGSDKLTMFFWEEESRPKDAEDVFRKVKSEIIVRTKVR